MKTVTLQSVSAVIPCNKLAYLEGIRGLAAVTVVLYHLRNTFWVEQEKATWGYLTQALPSPALARLVQSYLNVPLDGSFAVVLFWVLSGYVLSIKLFGENSRDYLASGLVKRYFRLSIPVLGSVLLAWGLLSGGLMFDEQLARHLGGGSADPVTMYEFAPDFTRAVKSALLSTFFGYPSLETYNAVLWTMQGELFGSLFCFLLFVVVGKTPGRYLEYVLVLLISARTGHYWLTAFMAGLLICDYQHTASRVPYPAWFTLPLAAGALLLAGYATTMDIYDVVAAPLLLFAVTRCTSLQRFFAGKLPVWLGKISFSLYLIHFPLICSFSCGVYLQMGMGRLPNGLLTAGTTLVLLLPLAYLFARYVDAPAVRLANLIGRRFLGTGILGAGGKGGGSGGRPLTPS